MGNTLACRSGKSPDGASYILVRSKKRKRTISLLLDADGQAVIQAPWRTSRREIDEFFERKKSWLDDRRRERDRKNRESSPRFFVAGEYFLYLGIPCRLEVESGRDGLQPLRFSDNCFVLDSRDVARGRELFTAWYRRRAEAYLGERLAKFSGLLALRPREMRLSDARCRWGACAPDNCLSFSWRLVMAPPSVIDYVVVHELTHIREKNHSRRFWNLLAETVPRYARERAWLDDKGHLLGF